MKMNSTCHHCGRSYHVSEPCCPHCELADWIESQARMMEREVWEMRERANAIRAEWAERDRREAAEAGVLK